jgi:hypothetical protein
MAIVLQPIEMTKATVSLLPRAPVTSQPQAEAVRFGGRKGLCCFVLLGRNTEPS